MKKADFIVQEYKNKMERKTNNSNSNNVFLLYIAEALSKPMSQRDRKEVFKIYKKIHSLKN